MKKLFKTVLKFNKEKKMFIYGRVFMAYISKIILYVLRMNLKFHKKQMSAFL